MQSASKKNQFVPRQNVSVSALAAAKALVVVKNSAGFDATAVSAFRRAIIDVSSRQSAGIKFVVYDFAHKDNGWADAPGELGALIAANVDLVMDLPVITIAWVRSCLSGADLEFALNCSMIVAEEGAQFSFAGDPFALLGVYAALGRKIGFVQTERLIENAIPASASDMHELMVVKDVAPAIAGMDGVVAYLTKAERRHNAAHAIFRAQKMAEWSPRF